MKRRVTKAKVVHVKGHCSGGARVKPYNRQKVRKRA